MFAAKSGNSNHITAIRRTLLIIFVLLGLAGLTGCSSKSEVELPIDFIREFIAKQETMVDKSLVYYYAREDQECVAEKIDQVCRLNRSKGTLENLEKATFDFSGLRLELLDQKEANYNDEPALYIRVAVKGNYTMNFPEESKRIDTDDVIILRMARHEWKVVESSNPWS